MQNTEGIVVHSDKDIADVFVQFFKSMMGASIDENQLLLLTHVTLQEIKDAFFLMNDNKSPRPDGYNSDFFKAAWPIVDLCCCFLVL